MATYTWIGSKGTVDPNDMTQAANWSPAGGPPGSNDTAIVGTGATLDANSAGSVTGLTLEAAGTDTFNFVDQNFIQSSFTLGDKTVLNLTGTGTNTAGFDINGGGNGNQTQIKQTGVGASLTINAVGTIDSHAFLWVNANGSSLTINVSQLNPTTRGDFYQTGPILDLEGTLTLNSDNSAATGVNGNRFSNAGYILVASGKAASSAKFNARMDNTDGVTELAGINAAATLEINTNMPGSQIVEFGGGANTVKIDATNKLPAYANVGTVSTTVLQNSFERFNLFGPGDTIDLAGVSASGLTYSFGKDATWGNSVLTLLRGASTVGRLRFTNNSSFADGTSSNFVLADDGSGGTNITVSATPVTVTNAGTS
jgi:hypothetical protein